MNAEAIREHEDVTKMKNVNLIEFGRFRMETWYFTPIPKEYWPEPNLYIDELFICEFCLRFYRTKPELLHHAAKCLLRAPPGDEVYRGADGIGMWEVDGAKEKQYCQNLCYLAKMFLDHKTLNYDVDLFLFFVMTKVDAHGHHVVGYFSKEKHSEVRTGRARARRPTRPSDARSSRAPSHAHAHADAHAHAPLPPFPPPSAYLSISLSPQVGYNLACILSIPCYQRTGFGRFLIQFSYELSKIEKKVGHPEKPLSDLGLLSYRSYWTWVLLGVLRELPADSEEGQSISVMDIIRKTSIRPEDIMATLQLLGLLKHVQGGGVSLVYNRELVEAEFARQDAKPGPRVDPARIVWSPLRLTLAGGAKKDKFLISALMQAALGDEA
jgi:hypothetical protein